MELRNRISINPGICHGKPYIKGTRIMVTNILAAIVEGLTTEEIIKEFPGITVKDIVACVAFANDLVAEKNWFSELEVNAA